MKDREIELKFVMPATAVALVEAHPLLGAALEAERRLDHSTYYDTPAFDLWKAGVVLRIRRSGNRLIQTVKAAGRAGIGRHEWECDLPEDAPDVSLVPRRRENAILRKPGIEPGLKPIFETEVDRRSWAIARGVTVIEASLDRGHLAANGSSGEISEFELELKQGAVDDLFAVARELLAELPLTLDLNSKSQRGYRLAQGKAGIDTEPQKPFLRADMSLADGVRSLCHACLRHFMTNEPILRSTSHPEALHQTRTAIRRLRAVLRVFGRHMKDDEIRDLKDGLRWLSRNLGAARDIDVMTKRFAAHRKTMSLTPELETRRRKAYQRVFAALDSRRHRLLLVDLCAWLESGPWTRQKPRKRSRGSFADVAFLELARLDRKLSWRSEGFERLDPEERHAIRIRAKTLYYVCTLTRGLIPRHQRKDFTLYLKTLKSFQSSLGHLNDSHVAQEELAELQESHKLAGRKENKNAAPKDKGVEAVARHAVARYARDEARQVDVAKRARQIFADAPRVWGA